MALYTRTGIQIDQPAFMFGTGCVTISGSAGNEEGPVDILVQNIEFKEKRQDAKIAKKFLGFILAAEKNGPRASDPNLISNFKCKTPRRTFHDS
jgi:hypothetical protein